MRVIIVGAGAMGCLFGFFLRRAGKEVWLLDTNSALVKHIQEQGVLVEGISGEHQVSLPITDRFEDIQSADLIILFVKAYDTPQAIQNVKPLLGPESAVLTLQNGIGNVEAIVKVVGERQTIAGTTSHGATVLSRGTIRHAGIGETVIGEIDGQKTSRLEKIRDFFESAGIVTHITRDITGLLWSKLIINVGINALTGITGLCNGALLDHEETRAIMHRAVQEAKEVADRKGIQLIYQDHIQKVESVCRATAGNISSMLQDLRNKKKTEIDFINGAIWKEGNTLGMDTPINQTLTHLVHLLENLG